MDAVSSFKPEIKDEPKDVESNFIKPGFQQKQNTINDKNRVSFNDTIPSSSVGMSTKPANLSNYGDALCPGVYGNDMELAASSASTSRNVNDFSIAGNINNSFISRISPRDDGTNAQNAFCGHAQIIIPDASTPEDPLGFDHSGFYSMHEKSVGLKQEHIQHLKTMQNCMTIPVSELSRFQQVSVETDEVFINNARSNENMGAALYSANTFQQTEVHSATNLMSLSGRTKEKVHEQRKTQFSSGSSPTNAVTFSCPICNASCEDKRFFRHHLAKEHLSSTDIYCIICNYKSTSCEEYLKHLDIHEPAAPSGLQSPIEINQSNKDERQFPKHANIHENSAPIDLQSLIEVNEQNNDELRNHKHGDIHEPSAHEEINDSEKNELFKCCECPDVFKDNDTLSLHTLNHKIATSLSQTEQSVTTENSSNCTCLPSTDKRVSNSYCVVHTSSSNVRLHNNKSCHQISLSCLSEELKSETEKAMELISTVTLKLESLAQSVSADCTSPFSQNSVKLTPTINQVSSLSLELANLTTSLGHVLLSRDQTKSGEIPETKVMELNEIKSEDMVYEESDYCKITEKSKEPPSKTRVKKKRKFLRKDMDSESAKSDIKPRKRGRPPKSVKVKVQSIYTLKDTSHRPHACFKCGKKFTSRAVLKCHMLTHSDIRPFKCTVCEKAFRRRGHLKHHMAQHTDDRPFQCEVCDYAGKRLSDLQRHSLTHEDDKNLPVLSCKTCSFTGRTAYVLSKHEKIHWPCSQCGHQATDEDDYKSHSRACKSKPEGQLICHECGSKFVDNNGLKRHLLTHSGIRPFQCTICPMAFHRSSNLKAHMVQHSDDRPFKCDVCNFAGKLPHNLHRHYLTHEEDKRLPLIPCKKCPFQGRTAYIVNKHEAIHKPCLLCGYEAVDTNDLKLHKSSLCTTKADDVCASNLDGHNICKECGAKFVDNPGLKRHMLTHSDTHRFQCSVCQKGFHRKTHLKKHMVIHSEDRPFKCEVCSYAAKRITDIERHSLTHQGDKHLPVLSCSKCPFTGRTNFVLSTHEKIHLPCNQCGHQATDVDDYKEHKRSHFLYACTECNYSSRSNILLQRHTKRKHNPSGIEEKVDIKTYTCEICGFTCNHRDRYRYHMIRHENRTPFACQQCDYKCSSRASFKRHKLMHAGLKPYLCSFCGASFRSTSQLNSHLMVHKDEKKHACRVCGRRFRAPNNLKMHEMTHTGEKPFKCHFCDFACRRNKELRRHIEKHVAHGEKEIKPIFMEYSNL